MDCEMTTSRRILFIWAILLILCLVAPGKADVDGTVAPIIGVLTQQLKINGPIWKAFNATSFIAASYVKFVEGGGGRVVPIWIFQEPIYYERLLRKLNGVLLPGGSVSINNTMGYSSAGEHIIRIAREINEQGTYFPVWGTCLGMELLILKVANGIDTRSKCNSLKQLLPLEFKQDYRRSRLFRRIRREITSMLAKKSITYNFHRYCYTEESFDKPGVKGSWRIMSLNRDFNGFEFVSTIEHVRYPFYGVQFHPEKPQYEFAVAEIPHTRSAIRSSQYFAEFLVSEARRNSHKFSDPAEQESSMIYNFVPKHTSTLDSMYTQQYVFRDVKDSAPSGA